MGVGVGVRNSPVMVESAVYYFCLALFAWTFLSRSQCSWARKGRRRRRVERREPRNYFA